MILMLLVLIQIGALLLLQVTGARHARTSVLANAPTDVRSASTETRNEGFAPYRAVADLRRSVQFVDTLLLRGLNFQARTTRPKFQRAVLTGCGRRELVASIPDKIQKTINQSISVFVVHSAAFERHV